MEAVFRSGEVLGLILLIGPNGVVSANPYTDGRVTV